MNIKSIVICASALAFSLCGCDKGNTSGAASGLATGPCMVEGALVNAGFSKAPLDTILGDQKDEFYVHLKEGTPEDFRECMSKAGLDDIEIKWGGISLVDLEFGEDGSPKEGVPEIVVALAFDHDADKVFSALKDEIKSEGRPNVKDATYMGETGLLLFDDTLTVAVASVAGRMIVAGTSEAAVEKGVALYRDGKGGKALSMDSRDILKALTDSLGERIFKKLPAEQVKDMMSPSVEDATPILFGLKDWSGAISATSDNGVSIAMKLEAANGEDAAKLAAVANENLAPLKMMMTMAAAQDPEAKPFAEALMALNVKADGATVSATITLPGATFRKAAEKAMD